MYDGRLRLMADNGVGKARVLRTLSLTATYVDGGISNITFSLSEEVAGRLDAPFIVAYENSDGGAYTQPEMSLFICKTDDADGTGPEDTVNYSGELYPWYLLGKTYLHWHSTAANNERRFYGAGKAVPTAGKIVRTIVDESKARGWGPTFSANFNATTDSSGAAWTNNEKIDVGWALLTKNANILKSLSDQGLCEWRTQGMQLRLYRPGTLGVERKNVVLGGTGFEARPVASSFDDVFTNLTVVPEKARNWLYLTNTGAVSRFGRLEETMTQAGVASHADATKLAQPALASGKALKREYSFDYSPIDGSPLPFIDFNVGDTVTAHTRFGKQLKRVIGITVQKKDEELSVRVIVGERIMSRAVKNALKVNAGSPPGAIGGNGTTIPVGGGSVALPAVPTGLHVESNVGRWADDGRQITDIVLAWLPVVEDAAGAEIEVRSYEIAARRASESPVIFATTEAVELAVSAWAPGDTHYVSLRSVAFNGDRSDWTTELPVTPAAPVAIIPKSPVNLRVVSNVASFDTSGRSTAQITFAWDAVLEAIDHTPVDVNLYELRYGLESVQTNALTATVSVPGGQTFDARALARTTIGMWGDPSPILPVTAAVPTTITGVPSAPVLTTGLGIVSSTWDGLLSGALPGPGFAYLVMEVADVEEGPYRAFGTPLVTRGGATIRSTMGSEVWVRFQAYDTLGRAGAYSAAVMIVVEGVTGFDIVDGTLTGNHIEVGTLTVDRLEAGAGGLLDISANESVTIVVGQLADQQDQITDVSGVADATAAALARHQTYYRFDNDGLYIGDPSQESELRLKPARIELVQQGVVATYWEAGRLVVDEAWLKSAQIGNHRIEAYGPGRTVIRPL